ncbi:MAG: response regulator [Candidatus Rokuibacteriota bacterium]
MFCVRRRHVLVVEDHEDAREAVRCLLEVCGHQVEVASDGASALSTALTSRPDVVLMDIGIPGIDGFEVARQLRASEAGKSMLLIALTGYGQPQDRQRALESGFDRHLVKPIDPDALFSLLETS